TTSARSRPRVPIPSWPGRRSSASRTTPTWSRGCAARSRRPAAPPPRERRPGLRPPRPAAGMNAPRWLLVINGKSAGDDALREAVDAIVAAGGDGTLSEVATALAGRDAGADVLPALGLVPMGTANDFASAAGLPDAALAALELLLAEPARDIDLLRL